MSISLDRCRHVHFVGIGGARMSALARYLLSRGFAVSGSDRAPGATGRSLAELGAKVREGHDARNLNGADLLVVTPAVQPDNPELAAAQRSGIPTIKGAELLAAVANSGRGIAVAGTHGKTTTSALIGHILTEAGHDPTVLIGGVASSMGSNARVGGGDLVVVEADEYDGAFLHLQPAFGVITNVAAEHLDYYKSFDRVRSAFHRFATSVRERLVVCADDPGAIQAARNVAAKVTTYGLLDGDWQAQNIVETGGTTELIVVGPQTELPIRTILAGRHMVQNILAAVAVCSELGVPAREVQPAVAGFGGVARRSERKGDAAGVTVLDDYAVHPTEIRATLGAISRRFNRPILAVFQPHTFSRAHAFLEDFARAFGDAHAVYVMDVYAARETDTLGLDGGAVAEAIARHHSRVLYTATAAEVEDVVAREAQAGDLVVTMGAGDVTELGPRILQRLAQT